MIVEVHDHLQRPRRFTATRILVRDSVHGNPIALVVEQHATWLQAATANEPDKLNQLMRDCGIRETIVCDVIEDAHLIVPGA